jgi:hypothetical protein
MKARLGIVIAVGMLVILPLATIVWAQVSANFDLSWTILAGGGGQRQSANYLVQDTLGQWAGDISGCGWREVQPGFWYGVVMASPPCKVSLPLALKNYMAYFEGPGEVEPNDPYQKANGPLRSGRSYSGGHDGPQEDKDFFKFTKASGGTVTVAVSGLASNAQVTLYDQNGIAQIGYAGAPPFTITCPGTSCTGSAVAAGTYYIRVYTPSGYGTQRYTLQAMFP